MDMLTDMRDSHDRYAVDLWHASVTVVDVGRDVDVNYDEALNRYLQASETRASDRVIAYSTNGMDVQDDAGGQGKMEIRGSKIEQESVKSKKNSHIEIDGSEKVTSKHSIKSAQFGGEEKSVVASQFNFQKESGDNMVVPMKKTKVPALPTTNIEEPDKEQAIPLHNRKVSTGNVDKSTYISF